MPEDAPLPLGVMADTGQPLPPIDDETLESFASEPVETQVSAEQMDNKQGHLGTDLDVEDPNDLKQTGWAVMYGSGVSDAVKKALAPLVERRRAEVASAELFKEFDGTTAYQPGDTAATWLERQGGIPLGDVDPRRGVPYYLMIVASPEDIPFEFQYGLDLYWAVGRLWFPTAEAYGRYAEAVVAYETDAQVPGARKLTLFAPRHEGDVSTQAVNDFLIKPLVEGTGTKGPTGQKQNFLLEPSTAERATKQTLDDIWRGQTPHGSPSLLFTGSHGVGFTPGDPRQVERQGALLCQEWSKEKPAQPKHYYAADDVPADARVHGQIHFMFACYSAGWPRHDSFARELKRPKKIAEAPALARLPQALLAHRNGGALAVLGHIDRAWSYSYASLKSGPRIDTFRGILTQLMSGVRIGHATDRLNQRWAQLSAELAEELDRKEKGIPVDAAGLRNRWVARDDARNYLVYGDPAVQLRVDKLPPLG